MAERIQFVSLHWGYAGIALGMALESACVPLPSELILPFAGYLAAQGRVTFLGATLAALLGGMVGSLAAYALGYFGGRPVLVRYGHRFWLGQRELQRAEDWVNRYGDWAAFLARLLPGVRTFISLPIGITRLRLDRFIGFSLLGSLPWTVALISAGFALGRHWNSLVPLFHRLSLLLLFALAVIAFGFTARRYWWAGGRRGTPS